MTDGKRKAGPGRGRGSKTYMMPDEFRQALAALGYDEKAAAIHLHLHRSHVNRLANGRIAINAQIALLLNYMTHFGKLPRKGWHYGKVLFFKEHG